MQSEWKESGKIQKKKKRFQCESVILIFEVNKKNVRIRIQQNIYNSEWKSSLTPWSRTQTNRKYYICD